MVSSGSWPWVAHVPGTYLGDERGEEEAARKAALERGHLRRARQREASSCLGLWRRLLAARGPRRLPEQQSRGNACRGADEHDRALPALQRHAFCVLPEGNCLQCRAVRSAAVRRELGPRTSARLLGAGTLRTAPVHLHQRAPSTVFPKALGSSASGVPRTNEVGLVRKRCSGLLLVRMEAVLVARIRFVSRFCSALLGQALSRAPGQLQSQGRLRGASWTVPSLPEESHRQHPRAKEEAAVMRSLPAVALK